MAKKLMLVPIREPLNIKFLHEHTAVDYYRYGEYPRFLRPPRPPDVLVQWQWIEETNKPKEESNG